MICTCIQHKTYDEILAALARPEVEMAEIRLDNCILSDEEIESLFSTTDTPLVATCRIAGLGIANPAAASREADRRLTLAIEAGARFADLEVDAPMQLSKRFQKLCHNSGTEIIRSYHNPDCTPDDDVLQKALARCFRYGADVAKIVTACADADDAARLLSLYSIVLEDVDSLQGRLIAFGMGDCASASRIECLRRGAPFTYAALSDDDKAAPGQQTAGELYSKIYGGRHEYFGTGLRMPASKSFAQRAIVAAALAEGTSRLSGYTPCGDSEAAINAVEALGAEVVRSGNVLEIKGIGRPAGELPIDTLNTGESGLLTRLMIPLMAVLGPGSFTVNGGGTLLQRPLPEAAGIMAAFGVMLSNAGRRDTKEAYVPLTVKGRLIPGTADVSGKGGSQLISGLLMALPLCGKDSLLFVSEPKSLPYMYITLDVLRHFGISTRSEMEGDAEMLEQQDWSYCTGVSFKVHGGQRYRAADFPIEGDWSAAANYMVAGAIFGSAEIEGLDSGSLQADLAVSDILVDAGAVVSQVEAEDGGELQCVRKAPLEAFTADLSNSPDLFPIVSVLAAFCAGESRLEGVGRLLGKESNRADVILEMLSQMGVDARIEEDALVVSGETLASRILNGRLLRGGSYSSHHDHRIVMALKVAELGAESPFVIDDENCVAKSFPGFAL